MIEQWCQEERAFLHEIATPLGSAMLMIDILIERMQEAGKTEAEIKELKVTMKALEQMKTLLQNRRNILVKKGNAAA